MKELKQFGKRLRELRINAGLAQRELAKRIKIDFSYISKIENGVLPPPSTRLILKLADVLNTDKDALLILAGRVPSDIIALLNKERIQKLRSVGSKELMVKEKVVSLLTGLKNLARVPIMLVTSKNSIRVTISIALTIAIGAGLYFAPPVRALEITVTPPSSGTLGSTHTFTVEIDVQDMDILPINNVKLLIYKSDDRATYEATCANLPLSDALYTTIVATGTSTSSGTVSITASTGDYWGYASGARTGYGYGYPSGGWGWRRWPNSSRSAAQQCGCGAW